MEKERRGMARVSPIDRNLWCTPRWVLEIAYHAMGGIDCDPAASQPTVDTIEDIQGVAPHAYFGNEGLTYPCPWYGNVWLNPPYGRGLIAPYVAMLRAQIETGACGQFACVTNSDTGTSWWQDLAWMSTHVLMPRGRIKFWHPQMSATEKEYFAHHRASNDRPQTIFFKLHDPGETVLAGIAKHGMLLEVS